MVIEPINNGASAYQGRVQNVDNQQAAIKEAVKLPGSADKSEGANVVAKKGDDPVEITEKIGEEIKKAIENINKHAAHTSAQFTYHEDSNKITVQIIDTQTDEVIKEFPAEKTLDLVSKAFEMVGLVVDEQR